MKKLLLSITLLTFIGMSNLFSQTVNDVPIKDIDVNYVQIVGTAKIFSNKVKVEIDFGQETKLFSTGQETIIKDVNGKALIFNSMIDALNFMSENGYEFVNAYAITVSNQNVYHYVLKKIK